MKNGVCEYFVFLQILFLFFNFPALAEPKEEFQKVLFSHVENLEKVKFALPVRHPKTSVRDTFAIRFDGMDCPEILDKKGNYKFRAIKWMDTKLRNAKQITIGREDNDKNFEIIVDGKSFMEEGSQKFCR